MNTTVADILRHKGDWVITIDPAATVFKTIGRMVEHNVGAIIVAQRGEVRGIFTERDYLRRVALEGRSSKTTAVEEIMTADVISVGPDTTVSECMALMTENKCRHLPVVREGQLAGVISIGDCVREQSEQAEVERKNLERYVSGEYPG